jgi:hypothetical protein
MKKIIVFAAIIGLALTLCMPLHAQANQGAYFMLSGAGTVSGDLLKDVDHFAFAAVYRPFKAGGQALLYPGGHLTIGTYVNCRVLLGGLMYKDPCLAEKFNFQCFDPSSNNMYLVTVFNEVKPEDTAIIVKNGMKTIVYTLVEGFIQCRDPDS